MKGSSDPGVYRVGEKRARQWVVVLILTRIGRKMFSKHRNGKQIPKDLNSRKSWHPQIWREAQARREQRLANHF